MYSFLDKGERRLTLRPEGTAPIVRAYIQNNLSKQEALSKLFWRRPNV